MSSPLRAFGRLCVYMLWNLIMVPTQALALQVSSRLAKRIPLVYHRNCLRAMGVKVVRHGRPAVRGPVLYVANHSSYLDITILGSLLPAAFVAKAEIRSWPIFGLLARLQQSVFVDRKAQNTRQHAEEIETRLRKGDSLVLFPEGTSGDGNGVLPFKSALFNVAQIEIAGKPVRVQPVSVTYSRLDGMPLGRHLRPYFTWYGDMDMLSHLWQMFGMGRPSVDVEFHSPVSMAEFGSRKALASHCEQAIANGVAVALSGRQQGGAKRRRLRFRPRRRDGNAAAGPSTRPATAGLID